MAVIRTSGILCCFCRYSFSSASDREKLDTRAGRSSKSALHWLNKNMNFKKICTTPKKREKRYNYLSYIKSSFLDVFLWRHTWHFPALQETMLNTIKNLHGKSLPGHGCQVAGAARNSRIVAKRNITGHIAWYGYCAVSENIIFCILLLPF